MSSQEDPKTTNAFQSLIDATKQFSQSIKKLRSLPGPPEYIICIHPTAAAGAYEKKKQTADLIDRQESIDALMEKDKKLRNLNWYDNPYAEGECAGIDEALSIISNLPLVQPAQPEIVRCKDCKHYTLKPQVNSNYCYTRHCTRSALISSKPDDYCSWAEKRTDDGE